ncbi:autophagy-related protein 11 [Rhypophila sp. PSN 637]
MAIQVLFAHSGQRLQIDNVAQFSSLDDFKASIARQSGIPAQCIIALAQLGRAVKLQTLQTEKEIFVYDSRYTQTSPNGTSSLPKPELPLPKRSSISNPPNTITDTRSLQSWQELFKARRTWALRVVEDCRQMSTVIRDRYDETQNMLQCLEAAVANLDTVTGVLQLKYAELQKWAPDTQADYSTLTTRWEQYLSLARSIPISPAMVRLMTNGDGGNKGRPQRQSTLEDLVDLEMARKAGRLAPAALRKFNGRIADLDKVAGRLFEDAGDLFDNFEKTANRSDLVHHDEAMQRLQAIEALANKVDKDCQAILDYSNSGRDVLAQASKVASNHTEDLLPSIKAHALEMDDMLHYATQSRNSIATESVAFMRKITDITSLSHSVRSQVNAATQDELQTFNYLRLIQQVPYMYASFVAEAIKRREWLEKVKQDSSTLANEMALFKDEEIKRRRKWYKLVGATYGPPALAAENEVPGLEINLLREEEQWPSMTRNDLEEFYSLLQSQNAEPELLADIGKVISELSHPTRQQSKRMKAFKNGSIHEAALGRSGLLVRGDDDLIRSLQDDNIRLQNKLKTSDSRVRRLENMLHHHSTVRPATGGLFQMPSQQLSERNDSTISIKSPRASEDQRRPSEDPESLLNRIQQLEAELNTERERCAMYEKDLDAKVTLHDDMRGQIDEVNSTKKDLLQNMEAQKREFIEERKSLEDEIKQLRAQLEVTEDEIEHFGESRENEKASYDEKVRFLTLEVERLTTEKRDEVLKAEGQLEFLRNEKRVQREFIEAQERSLQSSNEERDELTKKLEASSTRIDEQLQVFRDLWQQVAPDDDIPEASLDISEGLPEHIANLLGRLRGSEQEISTLRQDLASTQNSLQQLSSEVSGLQAKIASKEASVAELNDALVAAKATTTALEAELADAREQLSQLRLKIAAGETGSESLRKRLKEEEEKLTSLTKELAARQSQIGSLEEESRNVRERLQQSHSRLAELTRRQDVRTERAKDLTHRLYSQNDRLTRLLERLAFSVTRQGDSMVIQKIPRSERVSQSTNELDPNSLLRRSSHLNGRVAAESADLQLLDWMDSENAQAESEKYSAYISSLGSFDMDAFAEAVLKRVKDAEHIARKLQRDSRSYRDRCHALQKDAHDKIAFKNFKEGDLALFLPTRNQATGAWAAFNIGCPHYFLREQETHRLATRDWLVARISRVQERVVDFSKSLRQDAGSSSRKDGTETESLNEDENDNPFDLSDGLRWYLIDAVEYKTGAPSTPGLAKSTVAANNVEAMGDMHTQSNSKSGGIMSRSGVAGGIEGVSKTLSKSLESRRSSTSSRRALPFAIGAARARDSASETNSLRAATGDTPAATSPAQQHATLHAPPATGPRQAGDEDSRKQQPPPGSSEVRSEIDGLIGP